jgi:hypothetical protein
MLVVLIGSIVDASILNLQGLPNPQSLHCFFHVVHSNHRSPILNRNECCSHTGADSVLWLGGLALDGSELAQSTLARPACHERMTKGQKL